MRSLMICTSHPLFLGGVIKSRRMRWPGREARMGKGSAVYRVLVGKPEGTRQDHKSLFVSCTG
jgi:hypothetical protein